MTPERPPAGGDTAVPPAGRTPGTYHRRRLAGVLDQGERVTELRGVLVRAGMDVKLGFSGGTAWEVVVRGHGYDTYRVVPWCDRGGPDVFDQAAAAIDPDLDVREYEPKGGYRVWLCALGLPAPFLLADTPSAERAAATILDHRFGTFTL